MGFGILYLAIVRARQVDGWSSILACCTGSGDASCSKVALPDLQKQSMHDTPAVDKICANDEAGPPDAAVAALIRPVSGPPQLV